MKISYNKCYEKSVDLITVCERREEWDTIQVPGWIFGFDGCAKCPSVCNAFFGNTNQLLRLFTLAMHWKIWLQVRQSSNRANKRSFHIHFFFLSLSALLKCYLSKANMCISCRCGLRPVKIRTKNCHSQQTNYILIVICAAAAAAAV